MAFWTRWFAAWSRSPWGPGASILELIRAWDGKERLALPDDEAESGSSPRFAPGAWDGIATHHMAPRERRNQEERVQAILAAVVAAGRVGKGRARRALIPLARDERVATYADALIGALAREPAAVLEPLRDGARWLVGTATHNEPLKLGILLLGSTGTREDVEPLLTLARHDEFTLYAAVAAGNLLPDPTDVWWTMARNVHGWGKIHVVERLSRRVDDRPDVQDWLIRHGCENTVMPEYLACLCARGGRLAQALEAGRADDELLDGACLIFRALVSEGPAEGLDAYEDGVAAARALAGQLEGRCDSPGRIGAVSALHEWLESPEPGSNQSEGVRLEREAAGWTPQVRAELAARCQGILQSRGGAGL